jgi:hypothetical protein
MCGFQERGEDFAAYYINRKNLPLCPILIFQSILLASSYPHPHIISTYILNSLLSSVVVTEISVCHRQHEFPKHTFGFILSIFGNYTTSLIRISMTHNRGRRQVVDALRVLCRGKRNVKPMIDRDISSG